MLQFFSNHPTPSPMLDPDPQYLTLVVMENGKALNVYAGDKYLGRVKLDNAKIVTTD